MDRRVTIQDVARASGVSVAAVSKAINGRDGVAPATHARIMKVVEELGYESSMIAASMRRSRTNVIGVLVAGFEPFALELLRGVADALEDTEYDVLAYAGTVSAGDHQGWERRSLSRLGGTLIDGAILVTPTITPRSAPVPVVAVDPHAGGGGEQFSTVGVGDREGARSAVEHLISLGHRRIAHLRGRSDLESARQRELGYREALEANGIPFTPELLVDGGYRAADSTAGAHALLDLAEPPTAVFAANDLSAIEMARVAVERGLRIPDDLSVAGFDDVPDASSHAPQLTTVRQPLLEMGAAAVASLLDMLRDHAEPVHVRMSAELVVRGSTAPPPASHPSISAKRRVSAL